MTVDYRTGQVLDQIRQLPDASVDLVATSPPFLALRDYNGQPGQWGSEPDPASFLDHLLQLTAELRRVLAPHGSIAIEIGDTYSGSGGAGGDYNDGGAKEDAPKFSGSAMSYRKSAVRNRNLTGWPGAKSLCGTPTLFAWSLAYGRNLLRPDHTIDPWLVRNVIVWARANPPVGCVDDQTEALTPDGWKRCEALHDGELIAAYDPKTDSCRFLPAKFVKWHRDGEPMVAIEKRKTSQRLTMDHRCLVRSRKRPDPFVVLAADLTNDQQVMLSAPLDDTGGPEPVSAGRAELLGWYIAEGSIHYRQARIRQSLTANREKVDRIRSLLEEDGADFTEYHHRRSSGKYGGHVLVTFNVKGELAEWLNIHHKRLPSQYATTWPTTTLRALYAGLIGGDGHHRKAGGVLFHQQAKPVADAVQIIALRLGLRASLTYQRTMDVWQVTIGGDDHVDAQRWTKVRKWGGEGIPTETYTGTVWCPMVETSFWLARREGRTFVTGNSLGDKVRPATSYITVACPSPRRWFDLDAVRTPHTVANAGPLRSRAAGAPTQAWGDAREWAPGERMGLNPAGAPPLDHWHDEPDGDLLWLINTRGSSLAHYAMWPPRLVERLILSMCPAQVCRTCGEPRRRITGPAEYVPSSHYRGGAHDAMVAGQPKGLGVNQWTKDGQGNASVVRSAPTLGWSDCGHGDNWRPGHVLDTFAGTGTTLAVADILGRDATGVDLDPANPGLYPARYQQCWQALRPDAGPSPITEAGQQLGLAL